MKCTDKEWDTCQVEKMGCKGCYYDKIEIDEYIRNKAGYIGKVKKIIEPDEYITERYYCCETTMASEYRSQIIKHSNQLIDLMEVGDVIKYKIENVALETRGYLEGITDISYYSGQTKEEQFDNLIKRNLVDSDFDIFGINDFSDDFIKDQNLGKEQEELIIKSIVYTVTELTEINKIAILINGEEDIGFPDGGVIFNKTFSR